MPKKKKGADDFFDNDMMESIIEGGDETEEPVEIAIPEKKDKKGGKKTDKPNGKAKPAASKEESDEEVEEEKPKAKAAKASAKASAAPKATKATAKASAKATAPPKTSETEGEALEEAGGEADGADDKKDGKKKKKKGAAAKESVAPKKKGLSSSVAAMLKAQREEEERRQKEAEEQRLREIEEERIREEQEEKERIEADRIREEKKKERKIKEKERKAKEEQARLEEKRNALLQKYGANVGSKPAVKKPERKKNTKKEEPAPTPVVEEKVEEPAAPVVEEEDSWETRDTWEEAENEDDVLQEKPKEPEKAPEPAPAPAPTPVKAPEPVQSEPQSNIHPEAENPDHLRSPICCVLGHVDTGKTKLLDYLRRSNVQEGEAGGITQQIGATFFPMEKIKEKTVKMKQQESLEVKVPGLLVIDTPGHESFTNLRSRGSGLCDIAILVVDIMHGLEPQTIESINLLRMRKTPFIVALNKVDRLFGWKTHKDMPFQECLALQDKNTRMEFEQRTKETITYFAEQSLNAKLYYENTDPRKYVSLVPTSAMNGEGVPDLLYLLVKLTQRLMSEKLLYLAKLQCTVLEVKMIEGLGTTIDVILVNGVLHEGDTIVVCGLNGPIVTTIRALLTPQPLKEMRVKGSYVHHKTIRAAMGIKISAADLDKAVAGSSLIVANPKTDDMEALKKEVMQDLNSLLGKVSKSGHGVYVQASTLGSLEALLDFLSKSNIPVSGVNIGPISKKDVMKASTMLEHRKEFAVILAFDVKPHRDAADLAEEMGIQIFKADIIYHLFDQFTMYMKRLEEAKIEATKQDAVFPVRLKIVPDCIFHAKDPIVLGVEVVEGRLRMGTPICVPSREFAELGRVTSIQNNKKDVNEATRGSSVAIKIELPETASKSVSFGRTFFLEDELVSKISRTSIDVMKAHYAHELTKEDIQLLGKLKSVFGIK